MSVGVHLDLTMDPMEEQRFLKKHAHLIKKLAKELNFTYEEIERILLLYHKLQKNGAVNQPAVTKSQFREVLHNTLDMTDPKFSDVTTSMIDKSASIYITIEQWVRVLSLLLRGTLDEKIEFCFSAYNMMGTSMLSRDQMVHLLSNSIIGEGDTEDEVKDLIEVFSKKIDVDRDGKVSFNDFKETVINEPLLLEAFGPILPSRSAVNAFLTTFAPKTRKL